MDGGKDGFLISRLTILYCLSIEVVEVKSLDIFETLDEAASI